MRKFVILSLFLLAACGQECPVNSFGYNTTNYSCPNYCNPGLNYQGNNGQPYYQQPPPYYQQPPYYQPGQPGYNNAPPCPPMPIQGSTVPQPYH